jgi:aminopeptidase N
MKRLPAAALLAVVSASALGASHLELDISLDPATRELQAQAHFVAGAGQAVRFPLAAGLEVHSADVDGKPAGIRRQPEANGTHFEIVLPADSREHRVRVRYSGLLTPMDTGLTHRETLAADAPVSSSEGAFLPAGSGWYPAIGELFTWRLSVRTPASQIAVAPGTVEREENGGRAAVFAFHHPSQGVDLFVGPYSITEQQADAAGRKVRIRTYFHKELQPLAAGYLESAARFIARYSHEIGAYPYSHFSIVSSPLPTGFGMPSLTYLGRDVLRLPFIKDTSLGHEVLHNWWGNGVHVDVSRGNWSEGLTTFMSDYAFKEDSGPEAARDMRHGWLRDYAALAAGSERPLAEFRARSHSASSVIGYGKAAMMFFALRERMGRDKWLTGVREFWERHRFRAASFDDLASTFSRVAGEDLSEFFTYWLEHIEAPLLTVRQARRIGGQDSRMLGITLTREPAGFETSVPLRIYHAAGQAEVRLKLASSSASAQLELPAPATAVTVDPDFTVWRQLQPGEAPPILRDVQAAAQARLIVLDQTLSAQTAALAASLVEGQVLTSGVASSAVSGHRLLVGPHRAVDEWLLQRKFPERPEVVRNGDAQVWVAVDSSARLAIVSLPGRTEDARTVLEMLARRLPHLTRYSWVTFQDGKTAGRGNWPVESPRYTVD